MEGARLPTEEEFEYAAQGGQGGTPGDGEQPAPDAANTWQGPFPISDLARDGHAGAASVGCYRANALGAHDLIGNVWEWTATQYRPGHTPGPASSALIAASAPSAGDDLRIIKGGSFLCAWWRLCPASGKLLAFSKRPEADKADTVSA